MAGIDIIYTFIPSSGFGGMLKMIGGVFLFAVVIAVIAVVLFIIYKKAQEKRLYEYEVNIYYQENQTHTPILKHDRGGIYTKKGTGLKRFYLFNNRVGLNPDNVPFIFGNKGQKVVTLWQTGLKNFRYVNPYISSNPGFNMHVGEEDVNWAIATYTEWKNKLEFNTWLQRHGHILLWAITIVGSLFVFWFLSSKFDVMQGVATNINQAAQALRDANAGTIVK